MHTDRSAAEALRRQRFAHQVEHVLAALRTDTTAWDDSLADAERTSVGDGVRTLLGH